MNKKYLIAIGLVLTLGVSSVALAQATSTKPLIKPEVIKCVGTAVAAREAALSSAIAVRNTSINSAYAARAIALADAYTKTTPAEVRTAVKNAWSIFKTSTNSSRKTWRDARLAAWNTFKTASRACRVPGSQVQILDVSNSGAEVSD